MKKEANLIMFVMGILLALTSAAFMFFGILPVPVRITICIVGLGLIATSKVRLMR